MTRTGIGKTMFKMTPEVFVEFRSMIKAEPSIKAEDFAAAATAREGLPRFTKKTLMDYFYLARAASDFVVDLYVKGSISMGILAELCRGKYAASVMDVLAKDVINRGITSSQLSTFKKILAKGGGRIPYDTALQRAIGAIPDFARPEDIRKSEKDFGGIVENVTKQAIKLYVAFKLAVDLLPETVQNTPSNYVELLKTIEQLDAQAELTSAFIKLQKANLIQTIKRQIVTESDLKTSREGKEANGQA